MTPIIKYSWLARHLGKGIPKIISSALSGYPWISMESMDIHEYQRFHGYQWISQNIYGYQWISLISMYINGNPLISNGYPWISLEIYPLISIINGCPWNL
jgi:hypothetical protein